MVLNMRYGKQVIIEHEYFRVCYPIEHKFSDTIHVCSELLSSSVQLHAPYY